MSDINSIVPSLSQRSNFDHTHGKLISGYMGKLMPFLVQEIYPGDTYQQLSTQALIRLAPLVSPVMHEINVHLDYFYVPNRLVWNSPNNGFESFISGGETTLDTQTPPTMAFTTAGLGQGSIGDLSDYMGVTPSADVTVSALPFRAYALIYNEWYRDQNLQTALTIDLTDGVDITTSTALLTRNWEKDYYTACLPYPQKFSSVEVTLPLGTTADIERVSSGTYWDIYNTGTNTAATGNKDIRVTGGGGSIAVNDGATLGSLDPRNQIYTDLSTATAATINELREAIATQLFWEKRARGGGRYVEYVQMEFGVRPYDQLRRPEYLGGQKSPIIISEINQTSETNTTPQGTQTGVAVSAQSGNNIQKSFTEHGWVIGILSVMPRTMYMHATHKSLLRTTRFDYLQPEFQGIGEQPVLCKEVYASHSTPDATFGYTGRYNELRYTPSSVHGEFRDTAILGNWHMARNFTSDQSLNSAFVTADPTTRIHAVTTQDTVRVELVNNIQMVRPLTKYAQPSSLGM